MSTSTARPEQQGGGEKKVILVIGATGAMGRPIVDHLARSGKYKVRAFTRDPRSELARGLIDKHGADLVEIAEGNTSDIESVKLALRGVYGVFCNTDFWSCGEAKEIEQGKQVALAAQDAGVKHFVYSSLDHLHALGGDDYRCPHYDAKAVTAEFVKKVEGLPWTILLTAPYYENFQSFFLPRKAEDGTFEFSLPLDDKPFPLIALDDIAWFVNYVFDTPEKTIHTTLPIVSSYITGPELVETFTRVTGLPARYNPITLEVFGSFIPKSGGPLTAATGEGFDPVADMVNFLRALRDGLVNRDLDHLRSIHPQLLTFEQWLRKTQWKGEPVLVQKLLVAK